MRNYLNIFLLFMKYNTFAKRLTICEFCADGSFVARLALRSTWGQRGTVDLSQFGCWKVRW